jgi:amino acid transporter
MKKILVQIFCTKIGWLVICLLLAGGFGILSDYNDSLFFPIAMYASLVYPAGLLLVMLAYAWFINPIRDKKESKRMAEQYKKEHETK